MIVAAEGARVDAELAHEVLAHLDDQVESARRLLASILAKGAAIRGRDVEGVLARLSDVRTEMISRGALEERRSELLVRAGVALGVPPQQVTLDAMTTLMPAVAAAAARTRSSELRGLLAEIAREHGINRALMRQELAFLDHLVRMIGGEPDGGYRPGGVEPGAAQPAGHRVLDTQA